MQPCNENPQAFKEWLEHKRKNEKMNVSHQIGEQFISYRSDRKDVETINDILITKNSEGSVVKIEYIASHDFLGQTVNRSVTQSEIARSKMV